MLAKLLNYVKRSLLPEKKFGGIKTSSRARISDLPSAKP